ncbi:MAG: (d)CMP kinase [Chitinophagaceae bacterium]
MRKIIIAIDGFSSCGKSTLAKQLANKLQYVFVDTGAMYRAITLYFLKHAVDVENDDSINKALSQIKVGFVFVASTNKSHVTLNGIDVEQQIRGMEVSNYVSIVAALHQVRTFAVAQQQEMGKEKGIVMDGRDIGTTVFPNAELKIFVTASEEVRVERRYKELISNQETVSKADIQKNLKERDFIDSTRAVSPLKQAADAIVLDNSNLSREEQLDLVLSWVNELL